LTNLSSAETRIPSPAAAVRPKPVADTQSDIIKPAKSEERPTAPVQRANDDKSLSSAKEEPLVKRFLEVFRGDIAQVKPPKGETQ